MNALIENQNFIAVEDYGGFIAIFHFRLDMGIYHGIRIKKDKLGEVINALSQTPVGGYQKTTVVDASPGSSRANYDTDIVVRIHGDFTFIERDNFIPWVCVPCSMVPDLIELLKGNVPSGAFNIENLIINIPRINGKRNPRWTNVLDLGTFVVIMDIDGDDIVGGATIPLENVDQQIKILQSIPSSAAVIALSNHRSIIMLDADAIEPIVKELKRIKLSQQP